MMMAAVILLLVASCTSRKKMVSMSKVADYQWMNAKMTIDVAVPGMELNNISGMLRMRRDSTVWFSASAALGVESVRTLITQDSVILINRVNQTYLAEPISAIKTMPAPSLQEIQTMLLGDGSSDHVEIQFGPYTAKIRYSDIQWDEPVKFPIKINKSYERIKP